MDFYDQETQTNKRGIGERIPALQILHIPPLSSICELQNVSGYKKVNNETAKVQTCSEKVDAIGGQEPIYL